MNVRQMAVVGLAATLLAAGGMAMAQITIETVPVGNVGNVADSTAYGAVNYAYNIGKYEVTAGEYTEFLNAVAATDTYGLYNSAMWSNSHGSKIQRSGPSGSYTYSVAAGRANRPVNYVSWGDAARFANWVHNGQLTGAQDLTTTEDGAYFLNGATTDAQLLAVTREADWKWAIPTEGEWYKAAYYNPATSSYYDYPTSSNSVPSSDLVDPDPGNNATWYDAGYTIGSPNYRTEVGAHENSESPYDTFDMGGNVWEWNEAIIDTSYRGWRGGSYNFRDGDGMRASDRYNGLPTHEHHSVGFRVSEVPEPSCAVLVALGGLALIRRKRK